MQLVDQVPDGFEVLPEVDVVIDARTPATVRAPDVIIRRTAADDATITPDQVVLAVEIISPGSRRTDRVTKRSEYAEVGIAHYWIVDEQRTLTELTLTPHGYEATTHVGSRSRRRPGRCASVSPADFSDISHTSPHYSCAQCTRAVRRPVAHAALTAPDSSSATPPIDRDNTVTIGAAEGDKVTKIGH
ncbi:Uma2 family endonuclease [Gordonia sp. CPCC 205515]|uniref:Uma2 family endonuclease n=1 Tax=Gordonia sp. CPCC 205515 TaxID=3140791 RepID=UPI003AF3788B